MKTQPEILLASSSPRRLEIMTQLLAPVGLSYTAIDPGFDEFTTGFLPEDIVRINAVGKAEKLAEQCSSSAIVLGIDTVFNLNNQAVGKPRDKEDARKILTQLSGNSVSVVSAVCLLDMRANNKIVSTETTTLFFQELPQEIIDWYLATDEPMGKAGAFGIQGLGELFIQRVDGSFSNVIGMPKRLVSELLGSSGLPQFRIFNSKWAQRV